MKKLILMMGIPASGKSTFVQNHIGDGTLISRDAIRFSVLKDGDSYFSKEKEVCRIMYDTINNLLKQGKDVWVDATHLNSASRNKLLRNVSEKPSEIDIVWIKTPLEVAIKRNETRKGTETYVPQSAIYRMYHQLEKPHFEEGFKQIYIVENNKIASYTKEE